MRISFLPLTHCSPALLFAVLLFSTECLVAQTTPPPASRLDDLPDAPTPVGGASAAPSKMLLPHANNRLSFGAGDLASQNKGMAASLRERPLTVGVPKRSITFAPTFADHSSTTIPGTKALANLAQRIPLAHSAMLRSDKLSRTHPHLTTIIKAIKPRL
jgi:hypothetical protein